MHDWAELVADAGSTRPLPGTDESVAAAYVSVGGRRAVLVWCRFDVAAGTLSVAAGERFVEALDAAAAEGLPVLAVANSGGARMQEGTKAFVQMISATAAVRRLRDAGSCLAVYLADPTTGGVFASWASLGHVTWAEPGATIGFTGPRVAASLGESIEPASTQTAEGLWANGHVDAVVPTDELRARFGELLTVLQDADPQPLSPAPPVDDGPRGWAAVSESRREDRHRVLDELVARSEVVVELSGDRSGGRDDAVFCGLGRVEGRSFAVVAHRTAASRPTSVGLRAARRTIAVAGELRLPIVTIVDTPGAALSGEEERRGFAGEIARSIDAMATASTPTVAVVAGQGTGGAAIAWLSADRVLAAVDGWVAPIAPEAGSIILHRNADHAAEVADAQGIGAVELAEAGIVTAVHPAERLVDAVLATLDELAAAPKDRRRR